MLKLLHAKDLLKQVVELLFVHHFVAQHGCGRTLAWSASIFVCNQVKVITMDLSRKQHFYMVVVSIESSDFEKTLCCLVSDSTLVLSSVFDPIVEGQLSIKGCQMAKRS